MLPHGSQHCALIEVLPKAPIWQPSNLGANTKHLKETDRLQASASCDYNMPALFDRTVANPTVVVSRSSLPLQLHLSEPICPVQKSRVAECLKLPNSRSPCLCVPTTYLTTGLPAHLPSHVTTYLPACHLHTYIHTYIHTHIHTCIHPSIHPPIHPCIHCIHIQTLT